MNSPEESRKLEAAWTSFLEGRDPLLRFGRSVFRLLPSPPRCKLCHAPFKGAAAPLMRLIGKAPWKRNPRICRFCASWLVRKGSGGAEVEVAIVFADVRGSTTLAEQMPAREYGALIHRFFRAATDVFVRQDAIIDQLIGDAVVGLLLPGFAGTDYIDKAIETGHDLLDATGHGSATQPWLPIGVGVHPGKAYIGAVGAEGGFTDFTALGDTVNTAARLSSAAQQGELLVAESTSAQLHREFPKRDPRTIELKGKKDLLPVVALRAS